MIRQLYYQFLVYRSIVYPFLVLSAIVVPCWVAFRVYRRRARAQRFSLSRELLLLIVTVYFCGLAAATLEPNHNSRLLVEDTTGVQLHPDLSVLTCSSPNLPAGSRERHFCMYNAKGNFLLFVPLGLLIPLVWRRRRFLTGLLIAFGVSVTIEIIQYISRMWGSYRAVDINDVIVNTLGACLGLMIMSLLLRLFRTPVPASTQPLKH